jgi:hypothetical protein
VRRRSLKRFNFPGGSCIPGASEFATHFPFLTPQTHLPSSSSRFSFLLFYPFTLFIQHSPNTPPHPTTHEHPQIHRRLRFYASTQRAATLTALPRDTLPNVATMTSTIQRTDEDLINKSLLDSIDADHHSEQAVSSSQPPPSAFDPVPPSFNFSPRHSSPPPTSYASYPPDPYATQEDFKRNYARQAYPYLINGPVVPQQPVIGPPYRDPSMQKYPAPTALDVFGPQGPSGAYDMREPVREFGSIALNKPPPPHHGVYHGGVPGHHNHGVNGHHMHREEEISTIFVVGFPDDMQVSARLFFCRTVADCHNRSANFRICSRLLKVSKPPP